MTKSEYQEYLASREWAILKEAVRRRSGGRCERCRRAEHEQTHHKTYERIGRERTEDLLGVCAACHEWLSGKSETDPRVAHLAAGMLTNQHEDGWSGEWTVCCPVCCGAYSHTRSAFTLMGSDRHEAVCYDGTEARGTTQRRRSSLVVQFDGECGHSWEMEISQHKGVNSVFVGRIPSAEEAAYQAARRSLVEAPPVEVVCAS